MAMDELQFEVDTLKSLLRLLQDQPTIKPHEGRDTLLTAMVALEIEIALLRDVITDARRYPEVALLQTAAENAKRWRQTG